MPEHLKRLYRMKLIEGWKVESQVEYPWGFEITLIHYGFELRDKVYLRYANA